MNASKLIKQIKRSLTTQIRIIKPAVSKFCLGRLSEREQAIYNKGRADGLAQAYTIVNKCKKYQESKG